MSRDSRAARERCQPFLDRFFGLGFDDAVTFDFDDWLSPGAVPVRDAKIGRPALHVLRGSTRTGAPTSARNRSSSDVPPAIAQDSDSQTRSTSDADPGSADSTTRKW